ncbi:MAG: hypothetical protein GY714_06665 [Desulfobacterales bacterium]|nr:hypothetical protein [Desulfobacterales bacterium]
MHIPTYQIHNVIKGYIRHFCNGESDEEKSFLSHQGFEDRKDAVLKQTALDIIEKIMKLESPEKMTSEINQKSEFVFNTVDSNSKKIKNVLFVEDNSFKVSPL